MMRRQYFEHISETAKDPSTMADFLKLKPKPKPESKGSSYSSYDYSSGFNSGSSHSYDRKYEDDDDGFDNFWNGFFGGGSSKPRSSHSAHHSTRAEFTEEESSDSAPAPKPSVNIASQYAILGLSNGATKEQVKKAFRNYCTTKHPDKVAESEKAAAEDRFKEVNNAYDALRTYLNF